MSENYPATTPRAAESDAPAMSTPETLANIFFEPGRTFEALRARPRFLVAALVSVVAFMAFYVTYMQRVGYNQVIDAEIETARRADPNVSEEALAANERVQKGAIVKQVRMWSPVIGIAVIFAAGAGLYLLGASLMGGALSYKQALAVWVYSSFPPLVVTTVLNFLLLFLKPPEDAAEIVQATQRGLVRANAGAFVDGSAQPLLATALGSIDLLVFYGLVLAAIGLRKVGGLKPGSAWAVVLVLWGIRVVAVLIISAITGRAM
ncbi:MAG TPA: YIP1 family protein [Pyrinomonadaceae bacterium]